MSDISVGIDARMWRHSGIGTYLRNLSEALSRIERKPKIVLYGDRSLMEPLNGHFEFRSFRCPIYSFREQYQLFFQSRGVSVWHSPHYNVPFFTPTKLIVTIHDLIPHFFRGRFFNQQQAFYFDTMLRRIAGKAVRIIAVSESTREDLVREFHVDASKIKVIYEGVDPIFRHQFSRTEKEEIRRQLNLPETFILYVGLVKPHKNIGLLIETVKKLRRKDQSFPKLVLVGRKDRRYPVGQEYLSRIETDDDLVYLSEIKHDWLPILYQLALCFVLPSLYEGFGLTVLEAFASECPVICSNRGSLPEVGGGATLSFDPSSENELETALERTIADEALRSRLAEKGRRQLQRFSWENAAYETLRTYEEIAGEI